VRRHDYDERQEQEQPSLGEEYYGNFVVLLAELTPEQRAVPCARCTFPRECHFGPNATCPPALIEGLLCPGFATE
jgi:hypothetical protein